MILKNKQQQATCVANATTATPTQCLREATPTLSTHQWSGEIMIQHKPAGGEVKEICFQFCCALTGITTAGCNRRLLRPPEPHQPVCVERE